MQNYSPAPDSSWFLYPYVLPLVTGFQLERTCYQCPYILHSLIGFQPLTPDNNIHHSPGLCFCFAITVTNHTKSDNVTVPTSLSCYFGFQPEKNLSMSIKFTVTLWFLTCKTSQYQSSLFGAMLLLNCYY